MTNRYENAALEVEARIEELEARIIRFQAKGLVNQIVRVERELAELKKLDLANWRATGKWAAELWKVKA